MNTREEERRTNKNPFVSLNVGKSAWSKARERERGREREGESGHVAHTKG